MFGRSHYDPYDSYIEPLDDDDCNHYTWATGHIPMMGPPAQPNQVIYPILTIPENRPRLSREQWAILENYFAQDRKPSTGAKKQIAANMSVTLDKINNWFQNRRAKQRQEQKKAEAATRDGRQLPEPPNGNISTGEQETLQLRSASQSIGPTSHQSSPTPSQLPVSDAFSSHSQSTVTSPSEELGCGIHGDIPTSLPCDNAFEPNPQHHPIIPMYSINTFSGVNLQCNNVYSSPDQSVFSSPEQQFQFASQSTAVSASQSPEGLESIIPHEFSEGLAAGNIIASGSDFHLNSFVSSEPSVPEIAFPGGHHDSVLSSALSYDDLAPFFDPLSVPSTPTFHGTRFNEQFPSISTQAASHPITAASDVPSQNATFLGPPVNELLHASSVSLPTTSDHQPLEQVMPLPDAAEFFKPRQSSTPSLATRRRKNTPGAIVVNPVSSMGRSGSYTVGMPPRPLSPRSPRLTDPGQSLRRIKSSGNTAGRIQKPMTPAQRSPLVFAFTHNNHLLDNQTPPPSASMVETSSVCNVAYHNPHSMLPPNINFGMPWSAPPTQQNFMLPPVAGVFSGETVSASTPSPTSHPQVPCA